MGKKFFLTSLCLGVILLALPLRPANPSRTTYAPSEGEAQGGSLEELDK